MPIDTEQELNWNRRIFPFLFIGVLNWVQQHGREADSAIIFLMLGRVSIIH